MDIHDDMSPTPAKSVRFFHNQNHTHNHTNLHAGTYNEIHDNEFPKNLKSSDSLSLLIPQMDVGSPISPVTGSARSPRVHQFLHDKKVAAVGSVNDAGVNDEVEDKRFHSYHLDYKLTPPLVKGPCCVCGDGIIGAMVTALDKMWHPEHFRCVNCNLELIGPNYLVHSDQPYCKTCHNILFLPPCSGCKKDIEAKYVSALNKIWHPECFTCTACNKVLTPPNFYTRDFKPYCEDDYHKLFSPKCHACKKPITDDRKIEVGGRQWHPEHFKCCKCGALLTPNNYKEKNGKLYCENDFNDLFKPKCAGCNKPILQEPTSAMNKNWHPQCFCCAECKKQLSPLKFNEKNGKAYCDDDFHKLFSPKCAGCSQPIKNKNQMVQAQGKDWHPEHFCCTECRKPLDPNRFFEKNGKPYCEDDYHRLFSPKCAGCLHPIKDPANVIKAQGKTWHPEHFCCTKCRKPLDPNRFFENNGQPYCEEDYHKLFSNKCAGCGDAIKETTKMVTAMTKTWHANHFTCAHCKKPLDAGKFFERDGLAYCEEDYHKLFSPRCAGCGQPIKNTNFIFAMGKHYHPDHFKCHECGKCLREDNFYEKDGLIYCVDDFLRLFAPRCYECRKPINSFTDYCVVALGHDYHPNCFRCKDCNILLENQDFYEFEGEPYCEIHYHARMCPDCMKLRRAENVYWGQKDDKLARPSSSLYVMATDYDSSTESRPASRTSQVSSARIYDVKSSEESNWREGARSVPIGIAETNNNWKSVPVNNTTSNTSMQIQKYSHSHNHNHSHHEDHHYHGNGVSAGAPCCEGENPYERKILADANLGRQRNISGNSIVSRTSGSSTPVPYTTLAPLKSKHDHKHEQYFESGIIPRKSQSDYDNMKFQTIVTKDQYQTVSRNY